MTRSGPTPARGLHLPGLLALLVLLLAPALVRAAAPPLTIQAGPQRTLAFPATDLTLFGHVQGAGDRPLVVQWSRASGPAPVRLSAAYALTTTATFSRVGRYVLRLTVQDGRRRGSSTVTVRVAPASTQRAFYVDPDCPAGGDGSASRPWRSLLSVPTGPEWTAVNQALAQGPVIIYFSAREAQQDVPEETTSEVNVLRTDRGTHRLTLDGMSRYNADDAHPSWRDYGGACKFRIKILRGALSIGCHSTMPEYPMHYVTVRGFETTGASGRVTFGGNHLVVEHLYVHDITADGANVMLHGSVDEHGKETFGRLTDITIRNNRIERGQGEGIYVAGNYRTKAWGGWPEYGNTHSDVLIEGNTIRDSGLNGGEGDGIDVKTGLRNVTIRGNTIAHGHPMPAITGIICEGVFGDVRSDLLIENNRVSDTGTGIGVGGQNGVTIRNNMVADCARRGLAAWGDPEVRNSHVQIYNNTVYATGDGIGIGACTDVRVTNNLVFGALSGQAKPAHQLTTYGSTGIVSDYNLFSGPGPETGWPEGRHSQVLSARASLVVDAARGDFRPGPHSPAVNRGTDLSAYGFASDLTGAPRPRGAAWGIGAYERRAP